MKTLLRQCHVWLLVLTGLLLAADVLAQTYTSASTTYNWIDSSTHSKVGYKTTPYKLNSCGTTVPILDDTISDLIPIGFNFTYGATVYTQVRIESNGRLQFNNANCGAGTQNIGNPPAVPQTYTYGYPVASMNNTMKAFGVDLDPTNLVDKPSYPSSTNKTNCTSSATCYISYATIGTAPNRKFVVTWYQVPEWVTASNTSGSFNVQIVLNEDGTFVYQYGTISHGGSGTAQVGWQLTTTDYQVLTFGASVEPGANTAIIFYIPRPIASYWFEEGAWAPATAGQVADASGNARAGSALNKAQVTTSLSGGKVCRGANIPLNTSAATVDAVKTGVSLSDAAVNLLGTGTLTFWYKSNDVWNNNTAAQLLDATTVNGQWFYLTKTGTGTLFFEVTDSTGTLRSVETSAQTFAAGTWQHVAIAWNFNGLATANQDKLTIFINGVAAQTATFTSTGTVTSSAGYIHLGDNPSGFVGTKGTVNSANGVIDEVNIFNFEMSAGQVGVTSNTTHACNTYAFDHLELRHASWNGVACMPATMNVVACQNAACTTLYTGGLVATLSSTLVGSAWVPSGDPTAVIGVGQSSTTKDLYVPEGSSTLGVSSVPTPTNAPKCNGTSGSCVWRSTAAGLVIAAPVLIGGKEMPVAVQAVKSVGTAPLVACEALKGVTGSGLKLWATPGTPSSFPGTSLSQSVTVGGTPQVASASGGSYSYLPTTAPGSNNLSGLSFDSTATTNVWVKHMDVGQWTLKATLDTTAPTMSLSANTLVTTVPVGFGVAASVAAPAATQAACPGPGVSAACDAVAGADARVASAGDSFTQSVIAALWTADGDTDLTDNPVAPSYSGTVNLAPVLAGPSVAGASSGQLAVTSLSLASGTASTGSQQWNQAGALRIAASATYFSNSVTGQSKVLGRFSPHHFATVLTTHGCGTFTYSGQPIATVTVQAMDAAATPAVTPNYTGSFARAVALSDGSALTVGNLTATAIAANAFNLGVATAAPVYTFKSPQTEPATVTMRASNTDETTSKDFVEASAPIRSGRLWISNAYGSEFQALPVPAQTQFWSATGWQRNLLDGCTVSVVPAAGNSGLTGGLSASTTASRSSPVVSGNVNLKLSAPGTAGTVDISASILRGGNTWLGLAVPSARACFGMCGPRSPIIYQRERF